ncbi:MAG: ThiF family adenylyltransferase, partial [Thermus sp.]|uniref:HesA/MoeB/ThiF family protein n=1 Tax=Thermus sp. TaxID=275 RepID=UPI00351ABA3B
MWTKEELDRYHRQMILPQVGPEGQARLKEASLAVVGAGGLGVPVLQYLVAAG